MKRERPEKPTLENFTRLIRRVVVALSYDAGYTGKYSVEYLIDEHGSLDLKDMEPMERAAGIWNSYMLEYASCDELRTGYIRYLKPLGRSRVDKWNQDDINFFSINFTEQINAFAVAHEDTFAVDGDIIQYAQYVVSLCKAFEVAVFRGDFTPDIPIFVQGDQASIDLPSTLDFSEVLFAFMQESPDIVSTRFHQEMAFIAKSIPGNDYDVSRESSFDISFPKLLQIVSNSFSPIFERDA